MEEQNKQNQAEQTQERPKSRYPDWLRKLVREEMRKNPLSPGRLTSRPSQTPQQQKLEQSNRPAYLMTEQEFEEMRAWKKEHLGELKIPDYVGVIEPGQKYPTYKEMETE